MASFDDLNSTQQGGVRNVGLIAQAIGNSLPAPTANPSPIFTGVNTLGQTGTTVVASSTTRHGILFHNPGTAGAVYIYPTLMTTPPTTATLGGAIGIQAGSTLPFPAVGWPNVNVGFSAFAATGSNNPLTIVEFF